MQPARGPDASRHQMSQITELARLLSETGPPKILDLAQSAAIRGILFPQIHDGVYYMAPPPGITAARMQVLFNDFRGKDAWHVASNAQSVMDVNHRPILALDAYANRYFGAPEQGLIKANAIARSKVAELQALIAEFKLPFDAATFPGAEEVELTKFKPPAPRSQTIVTFKLRDYDWKRLSALEDELRHHLAESNLIREVLVSRHAVRGLDPEITLSSTDAATEFGQQFLTDLAQWLGAGAEVTN